ncbi:MAG: VanZ family protein [Actinomycetota bacterium]|nr:VanZ family protein [Actinomycetota bacterium]
MSTVLSRWVPPLALMALIFFASAQPSLHSGLGAWDLVLRKCAHMLEFGLLWFLLWRALGYGHLLATVALALAYAASDELHQSFVDGRVGSPFDVAIDAAGVGIAGALSAAWLSRRRSQVAAQSQPRSVA